MSGSRRVGRRSAPLVLATLLMGLGWAAAGESEYRRPEPIPAPAHNPLTPACIDLGKHLFFDPRLSGSNRLSCSGCHQPEKGWSDGRFASLEGGIDHYNRGGNDMEGVNPMIRPLYLTEAAKRDLIDFLKALSGPPASFSRPAIP